MSNHALNQPTNTGKNSTANSSTQVCNPVICLPSCLEVSN